MKTLQGDQVRLTIPAEVWGTIMAYAKQAGKEEVCGFGDVERKDGEFILTKVFIAPQEVGCSSAEITEEGWQELAGKMTESTRVHWHSHVDMGVFFSSDDESSIKSMLNTFQDYLISLVVNQRSEWKCRLSVVSNGVIVESDLPVSIAFPEINTESINAEIVRCCKTKSVVVQRYGYGQGVWESAGGVDDDIELPKKVTTRKRGKNPRVCTWCGATKKVKYSTYYESHLCKECRTKWREYHDQPIGRGGIYAI